MIQKLQNLLGWLNENQWLNLIFLILAILSIIISFYLYFKSKRKKEPVYLIRTFNLIQDRINKIEEVKIIYDDKPIKNLSITKAAIWNKGNEVINKSDIAPKNPIRFLVDDEFEILNASVTFIKNPANNFTINVSTDKKSVEVDFDYFYQNEGLTIEIYHTAISGKNIYLKGNLKDVPKIVNAEINKDFMSDYFLDNTVGLFREKMSRKAFNILLVISIPFFIPFFAVILPLQSVYSIFKIKANPSEFSLQEEN